MNKIFLICSILLFGLHSWSQTKNEHEVRVKLDVFPATAIEVVNELQKRCKRIRFYKETDGEKQSFEAKFKYNRQHYSLEFDNEGVIEDIEVIIELNEIEDDGKSKIENYFEEHFDKFQYIKIQKQYVYYQSIKPVIFVNEVLSKQSKAEINFEIIAEVKSDSKRKVGEFLFGKNGGFKSFRMLNPESYEHILY